MKTYYDYDMSKFCTFKTGGKADIFLVPQSTQELVDTVKNIKTPYIVLGNGSNILVSDAGIRQTVISTQMCKNITVEGNLITAQCGDMLSRVALVAMEHSLGGLEFAAGIPGTVGGGVIMNAGAYDGEFRDVIKNVKVLKDNEILEYTNKQCEFGYRSSIFSSGNFVILEATFELTPCDKGQIKEKISDFANRRRQKQPLDYPSAGSTFKRPPDNFAGALIEQAGLKGYKIGGAMVSDKHCGFIINYDNATTSDILELIEFVKKTVKQKSGVCLCEEIKKIGE